MDAARAIEQQASLVVAVVDRGWRPRADLGLERLDQGGKRRLGVGDQGVVGLVGLVDLGAGDVDVDQLASLEQV